MRSTRRLLGLAPELVEFRDLTFRAIDIAAADQGAALASRLTESSSPRRRDQDAQRDEANPPTVGICRGELGELVRFCRSDLPSEVRASAV